MSRDEPKAPLPGRLIGYAIVMLIFAGTARAMWEILQPMLPSVMGLLLILIFARRYLQRFL